MVGQVRETSWKGVLIPIVTPFQKDGDLDLVALQANVSWLLSRGATADNSIFLAAGSGGDFPMMNLKERQRVIAAIASVTAGAVPIIASVQSLDIRETVALCHICEDHGVSAVQISAPSYYEGKPSDVSAWIEAVSEQTSVPFAIYNNWYTGYDMPLSLIEHLLEVPNSLALKWSSPDAVVFFEGVRKFMDCVQVVNNTHLTIPGYLAGAKVFVSHLPNFWPEFPWKLLGQLEGKRFEEAQAAYDRVMGKYFQLIAPIMSNTAGEGVFVRPAMEVAGLWGGCSRLPSRDAAVTREIRKGLLELMESEGALIEV